MTFKQIIKPFKNIWQVIGAMMIMNLLFQYFFWSNAFDSWYNFTVAMFWGTTIWFTQAVGNSAVFHFLDKKFPWKKGLAKRAILTIICVGTYSSFAYFVVQFFMEALFNDDFSFLDVFNYTLRSVKLTVTISYSISFILTFIGFAKATVQSEIEKERLQTEMMTYKYESLRNQINPHFLFNSFNVLSDLVYDNQELAVKFIRQLSDLYRYVLDIKDKDLVPLSEELKFIESFTFLLKTRFENRVNFEIDVKYVTTDYIIPMALQLLIENCIKHNETTSLNPITISVKRIGDKIWVSNNIQIKKSGVESTQIGLKNLKERYAHFSDEVVDITQTKEQFSVSIPILHSIN